VIAARDNDAPFLTPPEFDGLLEHALAYFHDERDTRGFDAVKGWMHSAAHTSDLLKFLARSSRLRPGLHLLEASGAAGGDANPGRPACV
jgi:hypothetical protein